MAALALVEPGPRSGDPVVARLDDLLAEVADWVSEIRAGDCEVPDADRVDRVARLELARGAIAAVQAAEIVALARSRTAAQMVQGVHPRRIGRGIGDQIGLACRISPHAGSHRLGVARALLFDLPHTFTALTAGVLSERVAEKVVTETRHLPVSARREVDAELADAQIATMGVREAEACARKHAYQADRYAYVTRGNKERKNRRVSLRPAPDTMSHLTGFLPVEQGVACLAAIKQATDTAIATGDERSRDQIMADTLVQRLTGQTTAEDVNIEVNLIMPISALLDPTDNSPATLSGHGPVPADLARHLLHTSQGRIWWRRLFTAPSASSSGSGLIVGGDPTRRRFDGWLGKLIRLRDQTCRDPYCDAPIRHIDHIERHRDSGPTTLVNGRGVCERGNQTRELPGWQIHLINDGLNDRPHTTMTRTPSGHTYFSRAPDPP